MCTPLKCKKKNRNQSTIILLKQKYWQFMCQQAKLLDSDYIEHKKSTNFYNTQKNPQKTYPGSNTELNTIQD